MTKRRFLLGVAAIVLLSALFYVGGLLLASDEDRIKGVIESAAVKFEELSPGGVVKHVSEDYADSWGFTRDRIRLTIMKTRGYYTEARVEYGGLKIQIDGDEAVVHLRVKVTLKNKAGSWTDVRDVPGARRTGGGEMEIKLAREGWKTWRIVSVEQATVEAPDAN